jgi:preprotein translocase subunit SecB
MTCFPLRLEEYFFPHQSVDANPGHNPEAENDVALDIRVNVAQLETGDNAYGVSLAVSVAEEQSDNPPYNFSIQVFAVLSANGEVGYETARSFAESSVVPMLIAAVREHLASLTARGPWGPYFMKLLSIKPTTEEPEHANTRQLDERDDSSG